MVQSLYSGGRAEGERKVASSSVGLVGPTGSQPAAGQTTTSGRAGFSEQQIARSGSGGSECLFSRSTEELLDLDLDLELRSDLERQTASYHNNNNSNGNNFSIDDQEKGYASAGKHQSNSGKSCGCFQLPSSERLTWKRFARFRFELPHQLQRVAKMALKRHYTIMFCLVLVILSCLLASLAISRRVGDLDGDGDSTGSSPSLKPGASQAIVGEQLEPRTIDLVDLMESGKTFAFAKYRIQVKVPKSRAAYEQHPSFLLQATQTGEQLKSDQQPASSVLSSQTADRYFLTSMKESSTSELEKSLPSEAEVSRLVGSASTPTPTQPILQTSNNPNGLLGLEIKPVSLANGKRNDAATPGIEDIAALLAMTTTGERRTEGLGFVAGDNSERSRTIPGSVDQMDPLDQAASELNLTPSSLNKTLIDCFLVDTEKRYDQKVAIEDIYRQVASTRRVNFKRMMDVVLDCRRLTWASLPAAIRIKSIPGEQPLVAAAAESAPQTISLDDSAAVVGATAKPVQQPHDIIGTLLGSWLLHYGTPAVAPPKPAEVVAPQTGSRQDEVELVESRTRPALLQQEQRQASFLNMGISMVNGIIPNTLWCGLGDRAANYSELGAEYKVDACCRAHDHCPVRLKPFTTDYGLVNWSMSTRSHCNCDIDFNDCLLAVNSTLSNVIKVLYFRFVGLQCIDVENRHGDGG